MFNGNKVILHLLTDSQRFLHGLIGITAHVQFATGYLGIRFYDFIECLRKYRNIDVHFFHQIGDHMLINGKHPLQDMGVLNGRILKCLRNLLRLLNGFL